MPVIVSDDMWRAIVENMGHMEPIGRAGLCETCERYGSVRPNGIEFCRKHGHVADPWNMCSWHEAKEVEHDS